MSPRFVLRPSPLAGVLLALASLCATAHAGDRFVSVPWSGVRFEGDAPEMPPKHDASRSSPARALPYVVLDGHAEVFLHYDGQDSWTQWVHGASSMTIRADEKETLKGRLFLPDATSSSISVHRFEVVAPEAGVDARRRFFEDMEVHYAQLLQDGAPGAAWFRHRRSEALQALQKQGGVAPVRSGLQREPADPLDLFTGARAIAENLDLDRLLREAKPEEATIDITSIEGVTTRAYDWKHLLQGKETDDKKIDIDPLSKLIPGDQHAVFFPTFDAMVRLFDEVDAQGTPLLDFFDARVEDARTKERYQAQMLLPLSTLGRALGPTVISSIAVTGSDPFLVGGTDLVLLFECKQPALLESLLAARRADAEKHGSAHVEGSLGDVHWLGSASPDRQVSSYTARFDSTVVVTNSLAALGRIAQTAKDPAHALSTADEYKWFRDRYRRGDAKESALLVLTDATIRRWAGPYNRIGDARRLRAAAAMAEIQARHLDELVAGTIEEGAPAADGDFPVSADFVWTKQGVISRKWGNLSFLRPVSELDVDRVSPSEKQAYDAFRSSFQSRWRTYFDPIAVRFGLDSGRLRADATIRPLVLDTEYKELNDLTRGGELPADGGDPHEGALFHFAVGFNKTSELGHMLASEAGSLANRFGADPLSWIGSNIALYGERDPWWASMREANRSNEPDDVNYWAVPLAVRIAVKDPLKLAGFLTALRALADQSAPNLTKWESRTWQEIGYVRVGASEDIGLTEPGREAALYYVSLPDALVLSPREDLIKQSIDRYKARKAGQPVTGTDRAWLGQSAGLRIDREAIELLDNLSFENPVDHVTQVGWSALPILDEWKRRYPEQDPVALHERLWGVRLVSPAGGSFAWNEELQAMESTDYGRPGAPKKNAATAHLLEGIQGAELGLTFEDEGLRAVVEITKRK